MRLKPTKPLVLLLLAGILISCESEKSRKDKCNQIVNTFVANLPLDNYEILYKLYPDFKMVKEYWKLQDFVITSTTIDEDNMVSVIGRSEQLGSILFTLKKVDGNYIITNSKGLSTVFNSSLYTYCKKIGCIGVNDYDKDISQLCSSKEEEFKSLVYKIKNNIEQSVKIKNNNLSRSFGYISGDVTVKNYSSFTIPGGSYELYYHFLDYNDQLVFTKREIFNYNSIPFDQSITHRIFESSASNFYRIKVELKITSTDFIERIIAEHITGNNCRSELEF
jgi:hypothetical protein